jgi:hypothetical protein
VVCGAQLGGALSLVLCGALLSGVPSLVEDGVHRRGDAQSEPLKLLLGADPKATRRGLGYRGAEGDGHSSFFMFERRRRERRRS